VLFHDASDAASRMAGLKLRLREHRFRYRKRNSVRPERGCWIDAEINADARYIGPSALQRRPQI